MRLRNLCAATAFGVLATISPPAHALTCNALTDVEGDGVHQGEASLPRQVQPYKPWVLNSSALDLLSADLATGPTTVVGVLRLKTTNLDGDPLAPLGMRWVFGFEVGGANYNFDLYRGPDGQRHGMRTGNTVLSPPTVSVDATTITWTAPRSAFATLTTGATFDQMYAGSFLFGGNADVMTGGSRTYVDLDPSCVPAA